MATHQVSNQPPPLTDYDPLALDLALQEALHREGAGWAIEQLRTLGKQAATAEMLSLGAQANENPPKLRTHDRYGHRIDEVEFHPSWHALMKFSVTNAVHCGPWREPREGAHVARAAKMMFISQMEYGHGCPISMTYSAFPALQKSQHISETWGPRICALEYEPRLGPPEKKHSALIGMGMTEKQGGSDVRANTTRAEPQGGGHYLITGHKWFCSAPMSDAFLVLAQAPGGLSCFLLPRWDNTFRIQRLKDKLGNRSNASSEVEFENSRAEIVGEEGRGVQTILEMVNHTRLDCVIGAAAMMRHALLQAIHHSRHRSAFGKRLIDQPLMRNVLADLAIESEAATVLMMRLARAYDRKEAPFRRMATAVSKYQVCKRAAPMVAEALECLGGNGYVEESGMPRIYREAPLNSIWEGSGNVICLDVLRALHKEPQARDALLEEIRAAKGIDVRFDQALDDAEAQLVKPEEAQARRLVERLAHLLQGSLLLRRSVTEVSDVFCATRLARDHGESFGTLPSSANTASILHRAFPE